MKDYTLDEYIEEYLNAENIRGFIHNSPIKEVMKPLEDSYAMLLESIENASPTKEFNYDTDPS